MPLNSPLMAGVTEKQEHHLTTQIMDQGGTLSAGTEKAAAEILREAVNESLKDRFVQLALSAEDCTCKIPHPELDPIPCWFRTQMNEYAEALRRNPHPSTLSDDNIPLSPELTEEIAQCRYCSEYVERGVLALFVEKLRRDIEDRYARGIRLCTRTCNKLPDFTALQSHHTIIRSPYTAPNYPCANPLGIDIIFLTFAAVDLTSMHPVASIVSEIESRPGQHQTFTSVLGK
ncbi:hypothetical protein DENSPDRAFT_870800 [Dentipellis sp. KUC8613]|nr:hypothetical protein DENSPDRAFT_870800 [Dentipellis sp. KUC8613]